MSERTELRQLAELLESRERQTADRGRQVADARAALRREREDGSAQAAADREEAGRLLAEARDRHRRATRGRDRVEKLAARFVGRERAKWDAAHKQLVAEREAVDDDRRRLTAEAARFEIARSEANAAAALERQRLREAAAELAGQRHRAAEERAASDAYFRRQAEALAARDEDRGRHRRRADAEAARLDADIAAKRAEAEALDARVRHARAALQTLSAASRPAAPPAAINIPTPVPSVALDRAADRDLHAWAAELDAREARLRGGQAVIEAEAGALADGRRLLAEQAALVAAAREQWRQAERHTLAELEDLAHVVRRRERELDQRERAAIQADRRRREDGYALWQARLKLDGWRGVLTAHEAWWQTERGRREAELAAREARLARREEAVGRVLTRGAGELRAEHERLRAELHRWAVSRSRLDMAAAHYDRRRAECLAGLRSYAARALALGEAAGAGRRVAVLRRRWERAFDARLGEIDARLQSTAEEGRVLDERYREQHRLTLDAAARNADSLRRAGELDRAALRAEPAPAAAPPGGAELAALRAEVERLAFALMDADWPAANPPEAGWEEPADVLPFERRAA